MKNPLTKSSLFKSEIDPKGVDFDALKNEFRKNIKSNLLNVSFFAKSDETALACEKLKQVQILFKFTTFLFPRCS